MVGKSSSEKQTASAVGILVAIALECTLSRAFPTMPIWAGALIAGPAGLGISLLLWAYLRGKARQR